MAPIVITDAASDLSLSIFIGIQAEAGTFYSAVRDTKVWKLKCYLTVISFIFMKNLVHKIVSY